DQWLRRRSVTELPQRVQLESLSTGHALKGLTMFFGNTDQQAAAGLGVTEHNLVPLGPAVNVAPERCGISMGASRYAVRPDITVEIRQQRHQPTSHDRADAATTTNLKQMPGKA